MKKANCVTLLCAFGAVTGLQAQTVVGDFEGGDLAGWEGINGGAISASTIGATSGTGSMAVTPPATGFTWGFQYNNPTPAVLSLDVTWVASEWTGLAWLNLELVAMNSGGPSGWTQISATDPASPSYPGSWDPANWGDNTRTLTWDFSSYDMTGSGWSQFQFAVNLDGNYTGPMGNYYIDNVKLSPVPEPSSLALLGLTGAFLAIRRRVR